MVMKTEPSPAQREAFDRDVRGKNLLGYWMIPTRSDGFREPKPSYGPFKWDWQTLRRSLADAVDNVSKEEAHRRFIGFQHPDLKMGTTPNLILGGQLILSGETAPPHRHTMDAVRFVVEGDGKGCTVVEGERFPMHRWDLITTPNWSWHEHVNDSAQDTLWLDGAVAPLIVNFNIGFAEPHQSPRQELTADEGWSRHQFGALKPRAPRHSTTARRPPYRYSWQETSAALDALSDAPGDPADDVVVRYADPVTGGPTLLTVDCEIQRLRRGFSGVRKRHTHAVVYHALEGSGATEIGDRTIEWRAGDTFLVPLWTWRAHRNTGSGPALLFSISDKPVMASLGFDREETAR
ncbi:MAG: cupin domain-containing protein [Gemmatimonas sp.]